MADDLRKRNTDCVYFLASPLTCKKGSDCEYRHSHVARHNLKDCWYWLNGNCIHPSCPFRHPPLDVSSETSSQPVHLQAPVPVSKISAPCYFYFNGYCNKGKNCCFLHDKSAEVLFAREPSKLITRAIDAHLEVNNISNGVGDGPILAEMAHNVLGRANAAMVEEQRPLEDGLAVKTVNDERNYSSVQSDRMHQSEQAIGDPMHQSEQAISDPTHQSEQETAHLLVGSLAEDSDLSSDEEPMTPDQVCSEEKEESSAGFDVLVDDGSDQLAFEAEAGYMSVHDREKVNGIGSHVLPFIYEEPGHSTHMEYLTDVGIGYEQNGGLNDYYDCLVENELTSQYVRKGIQNYSDDFLEPRRIFHKRKPMPSVEGGDRFSAVDIREQPRKYRRTCSRVSLHHTRRHSSSTISGCGWRRVRGNLSVRYDGRLHRMSYTKLPSSRHEYGIGRHHLVKGRMWHGRRRVPWGTSQFSQRSAKFRGAMPAQDFEGPKPLSELLKDKKRLGSTSDDTNKSAQQDSMKPGMWGSQQTDSNSLKKNYEEENDCGCEYDDADDESDFERKLSTLV
ncbi:hypothetical protein H6P81_018958 [Aristolochia fimbriata]|uniref:C3H1-type domain-containing protein n=1 Tax=Aristolochia fimbriata TaxID=158543 RepID=A0AAV7E2R2_ARIFI|nr:hypothetical protein H6P81_018958 [Aristolochia fimbriata]